MVLFLNILNVKSTKLYFPNKKQTLLYSFQYKNIEHTCLIGFINIHKYTFPKTIISTEIIHQEPYQQFVADSSSKIWKYCTFFIGNQRQIKYIQTRSTNLQKCRQQCCLLANNDQCYFKTLKSHQSFIQNQDQKNVRLMQSVSNNQIVTDQPNLQQKQQQSFQVSDSSSPPKQTSAPIQDPSAQDPNSDTGIQVLIVILSCIFGVPFLLLLFFSIVSIVRMCRNNSRQPNIPGFVVNHRDTPPEAIPPEIIHLEEYKIDQIGPYLVNPKQQCPICLDENVNIRTYCGHHYHTKCIKGWFMKARNKCPVCMGHKPNPMKIYCIKCFVVSNEAQVNQFTVIICEDCRSDKNSIFSRSVKKDGAVVDRKINSGDIKVIKQQEGSELKLK